MPAEGRQNAAGLSKGDQFLVERDRNGKPVLAKSRTLALVATVEEITTATRNGRKRYDIHTDLGVVEDLAPIQTFWLATEKQKLKTTKKPAVPPAQFKPADMTPAEPVQMPPGFTNGQRAYETTPAAPEARCVHRSGCKEQATVRVVGKPWQYCARHGAEFEVAQEAVVEGRFELVAVR